MYDKRPTPEMMKWLRDSGSFDIAVAKAAFGELAKALTLPLKQGVIKGDILENIFETIVYEPGQIIEFPIDFLSPGTEKDFIAYTLPNHGYIPQKTVEGDYVAVPTFITGAAIDWNLRYSRDANWDVLRRAMQVLEGMFVRKFNNDGWHVLLTSAYGRNLVTYDDAATAGLFTKRLLSLMKVVMRRNAGGNSTSLNRGKLTDLWLSPESIEDIRSWDLTQVDEFTRREIYLGNLGESEEKGGKEIFKVKLHDLDELGVGQEYQLYFTGTLGGTLPTDKKELVIGLDLQNRDSFVHPVRQEPEMFEDLNLHRQMKAGLYAFAESGFASLDSRRCLAGAI